MTEAQQRPSPKTDHTVRVPARSNREMTRLGQMLRLYRVMHNLTTRVAASQIGITVSTLNRIEGSDGGFTAENYLKISRWLLERSGSGSGGGK